MIGKGFLGAEVTMRLAQIDERGEGWEVRWGNEAIAICFLPAEADRSERIQRIAFAVSDVMQKMGDQATVARFPNR